MAPSKSIVVASTSSAARLEDKSLCRGTPVFKVMQGFGANLRNSAGSEQTCLMSRMVEMIDVFLSHNWSTKGYLKFLVLCLEMNLMPAVVVSILSQSVVFLFTIYGSLPVFEFVHEDTVKLRTSACIWCRCVGPLTFIATLLLFHEVSGRLGFGGPMVFLDKTCIHQTDAERKAAGIQALPAFLLHSKKMLVFYREEYLHKLWTIYELASALLLNPEMEINIVNVSFPLVVIALMFFLSFARVIEDVTLLITQNVEASELSANLSLLAYLPFFAVVYVWEVSRSNMLAAVEAFDLNVARCFCEKDRELVSQNVAEFVNEASISSFQLSNTTGTSFVALSREKAVKLFNSFVHTALPQVLASGFGRRGAPSKVLVALVVVLELGEVLDIAASHLLGKQRPWLSFLVLASYAGLVLIHLVGFAILQCICSWLASSRGVCRWPMVAGSFVGFTLIALALSYPGYLLRIAALKGSMIAAGGAGLWWATLTAIVVLVFRPVTDVRMKLRDTVVVKSPETLDNEDSQLDNVATSVDDDRVDSQLDFAKDGEAVSAEAWPHWVVTI